MNQQSNILKNYFQELKNDASESLSFKNINKLFENIVDYETGYYLAELYLKKENKEYDISKVPDQNIFLLSLLENIPSGVDITELFKYSYKGVSVRLSSGTRAINIRYTSEIRRVLVTNLLTINLDTEESFNVSKYINRIKNILLPGEVYDKEVSIISSKSLNEEEGVIKIINQGLNGEESLIDIDSNININNYTQVNVKELLIYLLEIDKISEYYKILTQGKYIKIHTNGIYIIDGKGDIKGIPINTKIKNFFNFPNTIENSENKGGLGNIKLRDEVVDSIQKIVKSINSVLSFEYKKLLGSDFYIEKNSQVGYNRLIAIFFQKFGILLNFENLSKYTLLKEEKYQDILSDSLNGFERVLRNIYNDDLFIGIDKHKQGVDLSDNRSVAMMLKREQQNFLSEKYMNDFFQTNYCITIEEIELLIKQPEYKNIFISSFMSRLCKMIIINSGINEACSTYYKEFKNALGGILAREMDGLVSQRKFTKNGVVLEKTVLVNYFRTYGLLYLKQRGGQEYKKQIPPAINVFFRDIFFCDSKKIKLD